MPSTVPALAVGSTNNLSWYWRRLTGAVALDRVGFSIVLSIIFTILYFSTQTRYYTFDAISYAHMVQVYNSTGDRMSLFHPHHLLFNLTVWLLWRLSELLGYRGEPLQVAMDINSVLGGIGVGLLWLVLRSVLTRSRVLALLFSVGLGVSFGYWVCATDGRVNMPSLVLTIAAMFALVHTMQAPSRRRAAVTGLLTAIAALYHESAVLFVGVAWVGLAMAEYTEGEPDKERRARWRVLGWFTLSFFIAFAVPYLTVGIGILGLRSVAGFRDWAARYAELGWWWNFNVAHNLRTDFYAVRVALFVEPGSKTGTFHISTRETRSALVLYFTVVALWLFAIYRFLVIVGLIIQTHYRRYLFISIAWVILNTAFFTVWDPEYFVFRVPTIIASAIILAIAASVYRARRSGPFWVAGIGIWITLIGVSNYTQSILPHQDPKNNSFLQESWWVVHHSQPGDLYVTSGMGETEPVEVYLPYFAGRSVYSVHAELGHNKNNLAAVRTDMEKRFQAVRAAGGAVYAFDDIWHDQTAQTAMWRKHGVSTPDLFRLFSDQDRTLAFKQDSRGMPVWVLKPIKPAPMQSNPSRSAPVQPLPQPSVSSATAVSPGPRPSVLSSTPPQLATPRRVNAPPRLTTQRTTSEPATTSASPTSSQTQPTTLSHAGSSPEMEHAGANQPNAAVSPATPVGASGYSTTHGPHLFHDKP